MAHIARTSSRESSIEAKQPFDSEGPGKTATLDADYKAPLESEGIVSQPVQQLDPELYLKVLDQRVNSDSAYFDLNLEYTKAEEAQVVRILDWRLMTFVLLSTFVLNIDRTNISNAVSAGLPKDLGFTIDTVNSAQQVYAAIFTVATFTGAVLGKYFGPQRYVPILMLAWGLVTLSAALITNEGGFYVFRSMIALTEGGCIPATLVYLQTFYKSDELVVRLSYFWGVQSVASAVSGLMAAGLLQLDGVHGLEGWKWLFIVDGIITIVVSFFLYFYFPASTTSTAGGLRNLRRTTEWFTERQKKIAVTRTIRDDPTKVKHLTTRVTWADFVDCFTDRYVWGHLIITVVGLTPLTPLQLYLPTVIKSFHFNVFAANALTAPVYILQFISCVLLGMSSARFGKRWLHGVFAATWFLVGWILLRSLPAHSSRGVRYFGALVAGSWPLSHPLDIAWMTQNVAGIGKRTVASGAIIGAANIYATWSSQIYRNSDAPLFRRGNDINIAFAAAAIVLWCFQGWQYDRANRVRRETYANLSEDEQRQVQERVDADGSRGLLFKFQT